MKVRVGHGFLCLMIQFAMYNTRQLFTIAILGNVNCLLFSIYIYIDMIQRNDTVNPNVEFTSQNTSSMTCSQNLKKNEDTDLYIDITVGVNTTDTVTEERSDNVIRYTWDENQVGKLQSVYFAGYVGLFLNLNIYFNII